MKISNLCMPIGLGLAFLALLGGCSGNTEEGVLRDKLIAILENDDLAPVPYYRRANVSDVVCPLIDEAKLRRVSGAFAFSIQHFDYPNGNKIEPRPAKVWLLKKTLGIMKSRELTITLPYDGECVAYLRGSSV